MKLVRSGAVDDLLCRVVLETPVKLNKEQQDILKQFSASLEKDGRDHTPKSGSWFANLKRFFKE